MRNSILFLLTLLALSLSASEYYVFKSEEIYKGAYAPRVKEHSIESDSVVCKVSFSPCVLGGSAGWAFVLKGKGFDISSLAGAKAAQKFLENAGPEDAFVTEGPVDNEMDEFMGKMRLEAMLKCVKARIDQMIGGKK